MANYLLWGFSKRSNLLLLWIFIGFYLFFKVLLIQSLPLIFFSFLKSIGLVSYHNYKNHDFVLFVTSTILYFINVEDQLNSKNFCMRLPKFHPQYFLKLTVLYVPVHILGSYECNLVVWFPILFGIRLLLKRNKITNASLSTPHLFVFFQRTDSLEPCIRQPQAYLKSQKTEIKFNSEISFYTVFIGKLQKLYLFKSSRPEMFYKQDVLKNFVKFTGKHLCRSLVHYNVVGCCFCSLSGIYKRCSPCSDISFIKFISFLFFFAACWSSLWTFYIIFTL